MFLVAANTRQALVGQKEWITTGSSGIQVQFLFSDDWEGLSKFAVFRNAEIEESKIPIALPESNLTELPAENCAAEYVDEKVYVGVYGSDGLGHIIIPTIWVSLGVLKEGAAYEGMDPPQPTPDMWAQILAIAQNAGAENAEAAEAAEAGAKEAASTAQAAAAEVKNLSVDADTLAAGEPATVEKTVDAETGAVKLKFGIPQGPQGDPMTYEDMTEEQKAELVQGPILEAQTSAVAAVGSARTTAVNAVNQAGTTQTGAVNQAGTNQVAAVNQAGATQAQAVEDKGAEVIGSIPPDYSDLAAEVSDLNRQLSDTKSALNGYGINQNIGYLSEAHEGYQMGNDLTVRNQWLSYTDLIEIPLDAETVTVRAKTVTSGGTEYTISPSVYVYDSDLNIIGRLGVSGIQDIRTWRLNFQNRKYIRVSQPSLKSGLEKYIKFDKYDCIKATKNVIDTSNYQTYLPSIDGAPTNAMFVIAGNITATHIPGLPEYGRNGTLITVSGNSSGSNILTQLYSTGDNNYIRHRSYSGVWSVWVKVSTQTDIDAVSLFGGYITRDNYNDFFTDANNAPLNKIFGIQAVITQSMVANLPAYNLPTQANLFTFCGRNPSEGTGNMNAMQVFAIGNGGPIYVRSSNLDRSVWSSWVEIANAKKVYYVGPNKGYTSFTQCIYDLRDDTSEKTIYVDGGVYDIAQEYIDANIPVIPDDGDFNNDYTPYNVWIPENTHVIGRGNVVFRYMPDSADVTAAQSKTVSPLNIHKTATVENVTVEGKNCRYCLHMDSQGSAEYSNAIMTLKNVSFIKHENDPNRGWGEVIGVGFDKQQSVIFENCYFERPGTGANFYAHNRNKVGNVSLLEQDSSRLEIINSVFQNDSSGDSIKLSSAVTDNLLNIKVKLIGCFFNGIVHLAERSAGAANCFNVLMLHSGNPTITIDDTNNQYPVKVFQPAT